MLWLSGAIFPPSASKSRAALKRKTSFDPVFAVSDAHNGPYGSLCTLVAAVPRQGRFCDRLSR